jgi:hypothetical protein
VRVHASEISFDEILRDYGGIVFWDSVPHKDVLHKSSRI